MRRGERERTPSLDVFSAASPSSFPRFGLVVPKHGRRIVDRNRLKRRLRELGRREVLPRLRSSEQPTDVLVRTRPEAYEAGYDRLREELVRWVERRT
jgi:ribonuclease P protein component